MRNASELIVLKIEFQYYSMKILYKSPQVMQCSFWYELHEVELIVIALCGMLNCIDARKLSNFHW